MKKALVIMLLLSGLLTSLTLFSVEEPITFTTDYKPTADAFAFIGEDENVKVSLRFTRQLSSDEIIRFESLGVDFGDSIQHLDNIYLAEVSRDAMLLLQENSLYQHVEPLQKYNYLPTRDVSVQETYADVAWDILDLYSENVTGKGILIADLDTGIQWRHPDFFFPDGGTYSWFDVVTGGTLLFQNGTDGIDTNSNSAIESTEILYAIDIDNNGTFEVDTDWLWMDNGASVGSIDDGDTFFVVDDQNSDGLLDVGEPLIKLNTPKTKYIVHKSGTTIQAWERGVNLTSSTFYDTDGHGTGVAGILNGGQLGYRKYVGIAPDAELMAINVFGSDGLTVEEGLIWARDHGADVIIIELGTWTYQFLDGSSNVELMIDALTASGIPVIVPAGNLRGNLRHAWKLIGSNTQTKTRFDVSDYGTSEIYLTLLSDKTVDNVQVNITEPTSTGTIVYQLTLGSGYWNWNTSIQNANLSIDAFIANSTRASMHMIAIDITAFSGKVLSNASYWSVDIIDSTNTAYWHLFIADDISGWGGGATWHLSDGVSDQNTITWPSTADTAISVASYMSRNMWSPGYGWDAPYSAIGPRVDGIPKMSIAAPGGWDVVSAWSSDSTWQYWYDGTTGGYTIPIGPEFGSYHLFSGTSAAGPHVAGAAALMLQVNPNCGHKVKEIIETTAYSDMYTGALFPPPAIAHPIWGYGKLNVSNAVELTAAIPVVHEVYTYPSEPQYAMPIAVYANISNAGFVVLQWSFNNWTTMNSLTMAYSSGLYSGGITPYHFGLQVDYRIFPVNLLSIYNPPYDYSYIVGDNFAPIIQSVTSNVTSTVDGSIYSYIQINATVSEDTNSSGIDKVELWVTFDSGVTYQVIQMDLIDGEYVSISPVGVGDTQYHILAYDNAGNIAQSSEYYYEVSGINPSGTDTTTDTSTFPFPEFLIDNWQIIAVAGVVLIIIICFVMRKRK